MTLENSAVKIDMVTGEPFISGEGPVEPQGFSQEAKDEERRRLEKAIAQRNDLIADLSGPGGPVIREVVRLYVKRLEELAQKDPECSAYTKMLSVTQHKFNIGEKAITRMAEDQLKYAAPLGDSGKK